MWFGSPQGGGFSPVSFTSAMSKSRPQPLHFTPTNCAIPYSNAARSGAALGIALSYSQKTNEENDDERDVPNGISLHGCCCCGRRDHGSNNSRALRVFIGRDDGGHVQGLRCTALTGNPTIALAPPPRKVTFGANACRRPLQKRASRSPQNFLPRSLRVRTPGVPEPQRTPGRA